MYGVVGVECVERAKQLLSVDFESDPCALISPLKVQLAFHTNSQSVSVPDALLQLQPFFPSVPRTAHRASILVQSPCAAIAWSMCDPSVAGCVWRLVHS